MSELDKKIETLKSANVQTIPGAFQPGHPRVGGRGIGSLNKKTRRVIEICEGMNFHPAATLISIITTGKLPNADGTFVEIDTPGRLDALKTLCPYVMPRLQATQLSGDPEQPLVNIDLTALLRDPATAEAAQALSLAMIQGDRRELPAPGEVGRYNPQFQE